MTDWLICPQNALKNLAKVEKSDSGQTLKRFLHSNKSILPHHQLAPSGFNFGKRKLGSASFKAFSRIPGLFLKAHPSFSSSIMIASLAVAAIFVSLNPKTPLYET